MRQLQSCGVLLFSSRARESFLLLRHQQRYDLPKGHQQPGEAERACAMRELREETGLEAEDITLDDHFRYAVTYYPRYKRFGGERVEKTVVIFVGYVMQPRELVLGEHDAYVWIPWQPPHRLQAKLIDPLLHAVARHVLA